MFDRNYIIYGDHGKKADELKEKGIISDIFSLMLIAPLLGIKYKRKVDEVKDKSFSKTVFIDKILKHKVELMNVYRTVVYIHFKNLDMNTRIQRTFVTEAGPEETVKENLKIFDSYLRGGIERIYEDFTQASIAIPDFIKTDEYRSLFIIDCLHRLMEND